MYWKIRVKVLFPKLHRRTHHDYPKTDQHFQCLGLRGVCRSVDHICGYRDLLWLHWRKTENHQGILDGRPADVNSAGDAVVASQFHVRHYVARDSGGDLRIRDAVLDDLGRLLHHDTTGSSRLHSSFLWAANHQCLRGELFRKAMLLVIEIIYASDIFFQHILLCNTLCHLCYSTTLRKASPLLILVYKILSPILLLPALVVIIM